jgi:GTP-binding protein YchF
MGLKVGIVGLPNVGKSTLFNALLKRQQALAANYPFATIEPNVGVVPVPDARLAKLAAVVRSQESGVSEIPLVPATVEFVDIAGIVEGAHEGEGLGNKFLSHIRETDLIAQVVRDFEDPDVVTTGKGLMDDYQTVISELIFKDTETVDKALSAKGIERSGKLKTVLGKLLVAFNNGQRAFEALNTEEMEEVKTYCLLTAKPQIVVVNVDESRVKEAESIKVSVATKLNIPAADVVVVSAKIESEIATLSDEEARVFMDDLGVKESGLERLIKVAYSKLGLISFLTAGVIEVRAWTIKKGTNAQLASGVIHTDFIAHFIKAEVVKFDDFVSLGGWKKAREAGKSRFEGRDYIVEDGDVVEFKIGS